MKVFLAQMILAARNDDFEGWMQILVVVIMAVVYGLGGILKSAKSKKFEGEKDQKQQGEDARPAHTVVRRVYQAPSQPKRPKMAKPERVPREPVPSEQPVRPEPVTLKPVPFEQPVPTMAKEPQIEPQLDARAQEIPKIKPKVEELPEFVSPSSLGFAEIDEKIKGLEYKLPRAAVPSKKAEPVYFGEPLLDVSDPVAIRKAILHYEILGKPLSLRGQERAF